MSTELTNLIPPQQSQAFRRAYFLRLTTVAVMMLACIVFIQCILLIPTYLAEHLRVKANSIELAKVSAQNATAQEQQVAKTVTDLKTESDYLLSVGTLPAASTALRAVLAVSHPGITLSSFSFTPGNAGTQTTMSITGISDTREDLRNYDATLSALPYVSNADLPISVYAKDNAIPFTITLTGSLTP
jgi:hypothetical protein